MLPEKIIRLGQLVLLSALLTAPAAATLAQRAAGFDRPADFLDPAFHRQRRELLRQQMPAHSVAVLFAAPVRNRANDVNFVYHQSPDLYYLTGYEEPDAVLVLFKDPQTLSGQSGVTEALFVQPRDPQAELWTGRRLGSTGAKEQLKLQYVAENNAFAGAGIPWASFAQVLFPELPADVRDDPRNPADLYSLVATFRQQSGLPADFDALRVDTHQRIVRYGVLFAPRLRKNLETLTTQEPRLAQDEYVQRYLKATTDAERQQVMNNPPFFQFDTGPLLAGLSKLREVKTAEELVHLRRAVRISTMAQQEVMKALNPTMGEMEVQGLHEFVYRKYGAEFQGYPSIVGAGANACILHYETNDKNHLNNELVLMDCGAEYHGYSADVTRTVPPSGKFSPAQRDIYEVVLAAQEAGFAACKPGNAFNAPDRAAREVVTESLLRLGIISSPEEADRYFPHGTSHYLGLDVHDRGNYGPLQAGNVITVEPGIYIPEGSPCDKKWWNIGVRIEDDILITEKGWENLSAEAPRTVADIEKMMARKSALENLRLPELR